MNLTGLHGALYCLSSKPLGSGREGDVYSVILGDGTRAAKIYKSGTVSIELEEKLRIMISNPPDKSILTQMAWPLDLAYDGDGKCRGFIMPRLTGDTELGEVYKYPPELPLTTLQKVNIAQNICAVISEVHKASYVIGDLNPKNIGLDLNTGLVSFMDTDSYHVTDSSTGDIYRCKMCAPDYTAPELSEKCSAYVTKNPAARKNVYAEMPLPTFTPETDNFALAVHIFRLLMNGQLPNKGTTDTAIIPLEVFPKEIEDLFTRAFIAGKADPLQRPNAAEWFGALSGFCKVLVTCEKNPLHQYDQKNSTCPLCEADERLTGAALVATQNMQLKQAEYMPPIEVKKFDETTPTKLESDPNTRKKNGKRLSLSRARRIIRQIPGFRTGRWWKKAIALPVYAIFLISAAATADQSLLLLTSFIVLCIPPYLFLSNLKRFRNRLPLMRSSHVAVKAFGVVVYTALWFILLAVVAMINAA